jgi:hypothetical protein
MSIKRLMSLDPSINNLGMAIWDAPKKEVIMYTLVHPTKDAKDNEFDKSLSMLRQVKKQIQAYAVDGIIMETPETWAVAGYQARETGSMTKLAFVCGMLCSLCEEVGFYRVVIPREWKGQLSKEVMCNRLEKHYLARKIDLLNMDSNIADAIGIGHFQLYGRV